jgi:tetratricopeptide (TPR) repeat protein
VLAVFERALGPDDYEVAVTANNLAAIHQRRGEYDQAEQLYVRSITIKERVLGPDHPELATTLNNLATTLRTQSRYAEAEALYRRTLSILEPTLEPDHPSVITCRQNYAVLLRRTGRNDEATMFELRRPRPTEIRPDGRPRRLTQRRTDAQNGDPNVTS